MSEIKVNNIIVNTDEVIELLHNDDSFWKDRIVDNITGIAYENNCYTILYSWKLSDYSKDSKAFVIGGSAAHDILDLKNRIRQMKLDKLIS